MSETDSRALYRSVVDELVDECLNGQGAVLPAWALRGRWPHEPAISSLLARLGEGDRAVVGDMLRHAYTGAVHTTLRVIGDRSLAPFDQPYEGEVYQDFMGRLSGDWEWPDES